jgi:hypothetical protein
MPTKTFPSPVIRTNRARSLGTGALGPFVDPREAVHAPLHDVTPRWSIVTKPALASGQVAIRLEQHQPDWKQSADKVARENNKLQRADRYGQPESALVDII